MNEPGLSELNAQMMRLNTRILFLFIVTMPSVVDELARWRWQQQRLDLPGKCVSMCAAIMLVSHTHTRTHPCSYSFSPSTQLPKTHAQASDNAQPRTGLRVGGGGVPVVSRSLRQDRSIPADHSRSVVLLAAAGCCSWLLPALGRRVDLRPVRAQGRSRVRGHRSGFHPAPLLLLLPPHTSRLSSPASAAAVTYIVEAIKRDIDQQEHASSGWRPPDSAWLDVSK